MADPAFDSNRKRHHFSSLSFCGITGMSAQHDAHAGWAMPYFYLGYVGRRFPSLGDDMRLDLVQTLCCPYFAVLSLFGRGRGMLSSHHHNGFRLSVLGI